MNDLDRPSLDERLAARKREALLIDAETAEVHWQYANVLNPYGDGEADDICIGRQYFARRSGGETWVSFDDLPARTAELLWQRMDKNEADGYDEELPF